MLQHSQRVCRFLIAMDDQIMGKEYVPPIGKLLAPMSLYWTPSQPSGETSIYPCIFAIVLKYENDVNSPLSLCWHSPVTRTSILPDDKRDTSWSSGQNFFLLPGAKKTSQKHKGK